MLNKLTDIYINWCNKNNLPNISADEHNRDKLTYEQKSWLSNFIEIWDYQQNVDYFINDNEDKKPEVVYKNAVNTLKRKTTFK